MRFRFKALAPDGEIVVGHVAAENREAALAKLRMREVVPIEAEVVRNKARLRRALFTRRSVSRRDAVIFARELATMLSADFPLDQALDRLAAARQGSPLGQVIGRVSEDIKSGSTVPAAFAATSSVFPSYFAPLVQAGEATGKLPSVVGHLADAMERTQALRDRVTGALVYPTIVLTLTALSFLMLLAWVVPEFKPILLRPGVELALPATAVIALSDTLIGYGWAIALGIGIAIVSAWALWKSGRLKPMIDRLSLAIPWIGDVVVRLEGARYFWSLSMLVANGVPLVEAAGIASRSTSNVGITADVQRVPDALRRGRSLSDSLRAIGRFPETATSIVGVGEESGSLDRMLQLAADTCRDAAQRKLDGWVVFLTPAVTILLGVMVAAVIGAILSAIMSSYDVFI